MSFYKYIKDKYGLRSSDGLYSNVTADDMNTILYHLEKNEWQPIENAPKGATKENPCKEVWILGMNRGGEQRVIRWCMEYPETDGCWMYAYAPDEYIDGIQTFNPILFKHLDKMP